MKTENRALDRAARYLNGYRATFPLKAQLVKCCHARILSHKDISFDGKHGHRPAASSPRMRIHCAGLASTAEKPSVQIYFRDFAVHASVSGERYLVMTRCYPPLFGVLVERGEQARIDV
jgi:hypothetical protein